MTTWNAVRVLARANLLILRNTFWYGKLWQKMVWVLFGGCFALLCVMFYMGSMSFVQPLTEVSDMTLLRTLPNIALFAFTLMVFLGSFSSLLNALYLSSDITTLLTKPIPIRAIFIVKFFESWQHLLPILLLLMSAMLGYGSGMGYGVLYILTAVLVMLLIPLLPIGISALLVMLAVRFIPIQRIRSLLVGLALLLAISISLIGQFAPAMGASLVDVSGPSVASQLDLPFLPSAWAGRALVAAGEQALPTLLLYGGALLLVSLAGFAGCVLLAERMYDAGLNNLSGESGQGKRLQWGRWWRHWLFGLSQGVYRVGIIDPQAAAVFLKDWHSFPRDLRSMQQLIFPMAMMIIVLVRLLTLPDVPGEQSEMILSQAVIGMIFFMCFATSNTLAGSAIGREGRAFWLLYLAPISPLRILLGKVAFAYLPYPVIGTFLLGLIGLLRQVSPLILLQGWAAIVLIGMGNTCLLVSLGAIYPRLDWENPAQQMRFVTGCLGSILSTGYSAVNIGILFGVGALAGLLRESMLLVLALYVLGWSMALLMTILVVAVSLYAGCRGLSRIEV